LPVEQGEGVEAHEPRFSCRVIHSPGVDVRGRCSMTGSVSVGSQRFAVMVTAAGRGKLLVPVPFDPNQVWGAKQRHHIAGTVNDVRIRAVIEPAGDGFGFTLGRTSPARFGVALGDEVTVEIAPERASTRRPPRRRRRSPGRESRRGGVLRLARAILSSRISALGGRDETPTRTARRRYCGSSQ
jgi:hypothetical protein